MLLEAGHLLGERLARAVHEPAPARAPLACERGEGEHRAAAAAAVLIVLEAIAHADRGGGERVIPLGEPADVRLRHAADPRRDLRRIAPGLGHERVEALDVGVDERSVQSPAPLQLHREGPGEHDVGAGTQRHVEIGLLGELDPLGIHDDQARALLPGRVDHGGEVQIAPGDVVAPDDDETRVADRFRPDVRHLAGGVFSRRLLLL